MFVNYCNKGYQASHGIEASYITVVNIGFVILTLNLSLFVNYCNKGYQASHGIEASYITVVVGYQLCYINTDLSLASGAMTKN